MKKDHAAAKLDKWVAVGTAEFIKKSRGQGRPLGRRMTNHNSPMHETEFAGQKDIDPHRRPRRPSGASID